MFYVFFYFKQLYYYYLFLFLVNDWIKSKKLNYLAIPKYISSGAHTRGKVEYRFMVIERFGEDIEKLFCNAGRQFGMKTVCYLALRLVRKMNM